MPSITSPYNLARQLLLGTGIDLVADDIKVALVANSYVFAATDTVWADVSTHEITGTGYTSGGVSLANKTISEGAGGKAKFDADNAAWPGATFSTRYAVIYKSGTVGTVTDPLICCILLDDTPADIVVAGTTFMLIWHADGIIEI